MSQFTNQYNTQNGRMMGVQMAPGQNYPGNWQPQMDNQQYQPMQPNTQGWKPYVDSTPARSTSGRWVDTFDEIKPQEVPMDGGMYFFPLNDCSCIYARFWDRDGQLRTYRFLPEKTDPPAATASTPGLNDVINSYEMFSAAITNRLDSFDKRLDDILAASQPKSRTKVIDKEEK